MIGGFSMRYESESLDEQQQERLSKLMAYHLRHDSTIERSPHGFVNIEKLTEIIRRKIPWIKPHHIREVAVFDPRGRYELNGELIRARYGHSVDVKLDLREADVDVLYHGTTPEAAAQILSEGMKPLDRKMVHLSATVKDAIEVGKRRSKNPVVLAVDAKLAREQGVKIFKASERVYLAQSIPPSCVKLLEG